MGFRTRAPAGSARLWREESPAMARPSRSSFATSTSSESALGLAQRLFSLSTTEPTDLFLCRDDLGADLVEGIGAELPAGRMLLRPLRDLLLRPETSSAVRDAVWRECVRPALARR